MVKYNLNLIYGIIGRIGGFAFIAAGLWISVFYSIKGLIPLLMGAVFAFTAETTIIDPQKRKVAHTYIWFGFIENGNWIDILPNMKLMIKKPDYSYLSYGRKKRMSLIGDNYYYILLYDQKDEFIMPIKKFKLKPDAEADIPKIKDLMGLI
jgi:hypothetical protein